MSKKSKRIYILNDEEINFLYTIPKFSSDEREVFFSLTELEHEELNKISDLPTKIHFILQLGYFKAKQKLFQYNYSSVDDDVKFIVNKYFPNLEQSRYFLSNANKSQNNKRILTLTGFKEFTENIKQQVVEYAISLAHRLINHVTIFSELVGYIHTRNIILPAYTVMQDLITFAISIEERRLSNMIAMKLTRELDDFLMNMLTNQKDLGLLSFKKCLKILNTEL